MSAVVVVLFIIVLTAACCYCKIKAKAEAAKVAPAPPAAQPMKAAKYSEAEKGSKQGVSIAWLLDDKGFAGACAAAGVGWKEPATQAEWIERLSNSARISACKNEAEAANGHFFIGPLFEGEKGFSAPFQLAKVQVLTVVPEGCALGAYKGKIDRSTKLRVAPLDATGTARPELAVEATAGACVLRRTRELVYNYIGQGPVPGVTSEKAETYVDFAARELSPSSDAFSAATDFVSHEWSAYFCDTIDALVPPDEELFHAFFEPPQFEKGSLLGLLGPLLRAPRYLLWPLIHYFTRAQRHEHFVRPRSWTPKALVAKRTERYFWIDILHKNQHIVNSEGTAVELAACVQLHDSLSDGGGAAAAAGGRSVAGRSRADAGRSGDVLRTPERPKLRGGLALTSEAQRRCLEDS